jgi:hypothetical protein
MLLPSALPPTRPSSVYWSVLCARAYRQDDRRIVTVWQAIPSAALTRRDFARRFCFGAIRASRSRRAGMADRGAISSSATAGQPFAPGLSRGFFEALQIADSPEPHLLPGVSMGGGPIGLKHWKWWQRHSPSIEPSWEADVQRPAGW